MSVFRVQDKTPEVYTSTSRDFQLLGRLYDCIINGIKFDTDSVLDIINTDNIDNKLLKLLQTKLGFFSSKDITDESLRYILKAFPTILKHKGSLKSIKQAVCTFLKLNGIKSKVSIKKVNNNLTNPYLIEISLDERIDNTYILNEVLKYILPTGYIISYIYYKDFDNIDLTLESKIGANIIIVKDSVSSLVRGNYIEYKNNIEDNLIGSIGETQISSPYDITYMGFIDSIARLPNYTSNWQSHVGEVYCIYNHSTLESDFSVSFYIYELNKNSDQYEWREIESNRSYNIFDSAVYGYYDLESDKFYSKKKSSYKDDEVYAPIGLRISDNSIPSAASIPINSDYFLIDSSYNLIWSADNSSNSWVSHNLTEYGTEFEDGDPNSDYVKLLPKEWSVVYRNSSEEYFVDEAIWTTSLASQNKYFWDPIILDTSKIQELSDNVTCTISGNPESAEILSDKNNCIFSNSKYYTYSYTENKWVPVNIVYISGNPNLIVNIIPDKNVNIYNNNKSWSADIDEYSSELESLSDKILYIDSETSNGYEYDSDDNTFKEVLHFMKASNVYDINMNELNYLIENGLVRPAFKNNTTIFKDAYDNIFLL